MKKLTLDSAESLASKFRVDIGASLNEPINVKAILRKLNILTIFKPLSDQLCGLSLKSATGRRFILCNSRSTKGRQHFTLAHEFYHLFYDENPIPHVCSVENGGKNTNEKNADAFASALLMPKGGLLQFISEKELTEKELHIATLLKLEHYYSVSRLSLLTRLKALGLLSEKSYTMLKAYPIVESAKQYGYETSLYFKGEDFLVIGDYVEKARRLFEQGSISEGHYNELINLITNDEN